MKLSSATGRFLGAVALLTALTPTPIAAAETPEHPPLALGKSLPSFSLPGVDGKTYSPKSFESSKLLVLVFTCNHCPTAQAYEERIKSLAREYGRRGAAIVAVNPNHNPAVRLDELGYTDLDDSFDAMKIRATAKQFNFPYLDDGPKEEFSKQLGPVATPHAFVFDQKRTLRYQGRIDNNEREELVKTRDLESAIDALLRDQDPPLSRTKVFGCSTKWDHKAESNQRWREKIRSEPVTLETADQGALAKLRTEKTGKVRLINFWATWCGPCVAEFDELVEINFQFRHREFEMATVSAQFPDEKDKVHAFLKKHHASVKNYLFGEPDKYRLMEAADPEWSGALPHTILVGPAGQILWRQTGELDLLELRRRIVPALNAITPWPGMSDAK